MRNFVSITHQKLGGFTKKTGKKMFFFARKQSNEITFVFFFASNVFSIKMWVLRELNHRKNTAENDYYLQELIAVKLNLTVNVEN